MNLLVAILLVVSNLVIAVSPDNEIGAPQYPNATDLPEATERLKEKKAATWLAARAYHTDDSIKAVVKYFREQAEKTKSSADDNPLLRQLLDNNWKIKKGTVWGASSVFGWSRSFKEAASKQDAETSFGVLVLDDSFVRVHLMSPHPSPANDETLVTGTMIVMIRERIPSAGGVDGSASSGETEKPYTGRDVTRKVRIIAKPEPDGVPGVRGAVILKAVFSSSGKVVNIVVVSGVPGLTERAIEAARKIRFEPAIKDGRYVSQWLQLEYHFH